MICPDLAVPSYIIFSADAPPLLYYSHIPAIVISLFFGFFVYFKNKYSLISKILLSILSLYFVYVFIEKKDVSIRIKVLLGLIILPSIIFTPTRYNLSGFDLTLCGCAGFEEKYFLDYYYIASFLMFFWILFLAISRYRKAEQKFKKQIVLLTIGIESFLFSFFITGFLASYLADIGYLKDYRFDT